jgi:hypothetical protein
LKFWIVIALVLSAVAGWSAFWFVGRDAQVDAIERWTADRREKGWTAEYADLSVAGFPNRYDARIERLALGEPARGWEWTAPEFKLYTLSYEPNHVIAEWPALQTLSLAGEEIDIASASMRASAVFEPGFSLPLDRASVDMEAVEATGASGWTAGARRWTQHLRQSEREDAPDNAYEFRLDADGLRPPEALRLLLGPDAPVMIDTAVAEGEVTLDAPLDRRAFEGGGAQLTAMRLKELTFSWGPMRIEAQGDAVVDAKGRPEGEFEVTAHQWRELLNGLAASGAVGRSEASAIESALGFVAALGGNPDVIEAPLSFRRGAMLLGPIPIGTAPVIATPR